MLKVFPLPSDPPESCSMPAHRWDLPTGTQQDREEEEEGLEHELLPEMGIPLPPERLCGNNSQTLYDCY